MPDRPDYSGYRLESQRVTLDDMAELAARLGSPDVYDRQGTVIFMDCFNNGVVPYEIASADLISNITLSVATAEYGHYSLKLQTAIGTGFGGTVTKRVNPVRLNKSGFEIGINFVTTFNYYIFRVKQVHDTIQYLYQFYIYGDDKKVSYTNSAGTLTKLSDLPDLFSGVGMFRNIKFVIDLANKEYVRLMIDDMLFSMTGLGASVIGTGFGDEIKIELLQHQTSDTVTTAYLGHMIATSDEI